MAGISRSPDSVYNSRCDVRGLFHSLTTPSDVHYSRWCLAPGDAPLLPVTRAIFTRHHTTLRCSGWTFADVLGVPNDPSLLNLPAIVPHSISFGG